MASVTIDHVKKRFGTVDVLHGVDIAIADGSFTVLVGPSGCGKSTLLRMIAGLEQISDGEIRIGDRRVNELPPKQRDVAMVFQIYALYPHMTVRENMAFALMLSSPAIMRSSVLLPQPDGPTMTMNSPSAISASTPWITFTALAPWP